ncbi:hypothetical protein LTR29_013898 [Friedmanniomyces endolithicus]|nr:hypothetical protein LTR29_013898 [Friedmanniomyces endolithicus]
MDTWQAAQSWILFTGVVGSLGAYYYYSQHGTGSAAKTRLERRALAADSRGRKQSIERVDRDTKGHPKKAADGKDQGKKRKVAKPEGPVQTQSTPEIVVQQEGREEKEDMSNKKFAEQMAKARKGAAISGPKGKENRVKTVKQRSAMDPPMLSSGSSQAGLDADDDMSPVASPALPAGDVSDMLEPTAKGPSVLRLTVSAQPAKPKVVRQSKEEDVETKKQRQNRMKKEQQRAERVEEEKSRKALEEKQRRAAREARGEPAKNGIPLPKPPANNAWTEPKPNKSEATPAVNGNGPTNGPLLDTFDAESTASSNGGPEPSTAATSTTEAEANDRDHEKLSEEDQVAMAVKQSEDESGWTTAAPKKKKQEKKKPAAAEASGNSTAVEPTAVAKKAAPAVSKSTVNGGAPSGFLALNDHGDASDPASWDP